MLTRFSSAALDLSRVDRTEVFPTHSYETYLAERKADLVARFQAAGIEYDVVNLETDPQIIGQETSNYRELLTRQSVNDAQAAVLLAFSYGAFLDRLGDAVRTERLPDESDDRYRARIQLAPEALSTAGTPGGYIYHAVSVSTEVRDVGLTVLHRGTPNVTVEITILAASGSGVPSDDLVGAVRLKLRGEQIGLLTDAIAVRPAQVLGYDYAATLYVRPGPDKAMVKAAAEAAIVKAADRYKRIGGDVPANALDAAAYVSDVQEVVRSAPVADIETKHWQAAHLNSVTLTMETAHD